MSPETRKELDRIDMFLANQPSVVARELWNILTALRGPDNGNDAIKDETTCVIRTKAFPQLANSFFQVIRLVLYSPCLMDYQSI